MNTALTFCYFCVKTKVNAEKKRSLMTTMFKRQWLRKGFATALALPLSVINKMKLKDWILTLILFIGVLNKGLACMCGGDTNIKNYKLEIYDVIFLGELMNAKHHSEIKINETAVFPAEVDSFKIVKVWKGDIEVGQEIAVYQFGIGCTNSLLAKDEGSRFVIAADRNTQVIDGLEGIDKFLQTDLCSPIIHEGWDNLNFKEATRFLDSKFKKVDRQESKRSRPCIGLIIIFALALIIIGMIRKKRPDNTV